MAARPCVAAALLVLLAALPRSAVATCQTGGGTPVAPALSTVFLRSYRASFHAPTRIAVDVSGSVYVTDPTRGEVVVRWPSGRIRARKQGLGYPISVAVGADERIYVGDGRSGSITVFDGEWRVLGHLGQGAGEIPLPADIAVDDASGQVYVTDTTRHLIKRYDADGVPIGSFGGFGSAEGQLNTPVGVFVDAAAREVLVSDQLNHRVQIFDVDGAVVSCVGAQGGGPGHFNVPQGLWADEVGRIYVADAFEGRVQVLDRTGAFVAFIGDFGTERGKLRVPMDVAIDGTHRLFVTAANNARIEMWGLDAFTDPETIIPAEVDLQPDPLLHPRGAPVVVADIEVAGYPLAEIDGATVTANGVPAQGAPVIGDHDGDGLPDARIEFDTAAVLETVPTEGPAAITVRGRLGGGEFEATGTVRVVAGGACGPGAPPVCTLGAAERQCNEALCLEPTGCVVRPKENGIPCDDGDPCTAGDACRSGSCAGQIPLVCGDANPCTDDACDPQLGCVFTPTTAPCDDGNACTTGDRCTDGACAGGLSLTCDDANLCTEDACDPAEGCTFVPTTRSCDDGNACTTADQCARGACVGAPIRCDDANVCTDDSCDERRGCVNAPNLGPCEDGDPGTIGDACDEVGSCVGRAATGLYGILRGRDPLPSDGTSDDTRVSLGRRALVEGNVATDRIDLNAFGAIGGDAVALAASGTAMRFGGSNRVGGDLATGGGSIAGLADVTVGGVVDTGGTADVLGEALAAGVRASTRRTDFEALPNDPSLGVPPFVDVRRGEVYRIPPRGTLGAGRVVINTTRVRVGAFARLIIAAVPSTEEVVVRLQGRPAGLVLGRSAAIELEGVSPERVIFVVNGRVTLRSGASLAGTVLATGRVRLGRGSRLLGAIVGSEDVLLARDATVEHHPFRGW